MNMICVHPLGSALYSLAGRRVLIVDDEADWRCLLRKTLEACSAEVCESEAVEEALAILDSGRVDLIVTDIEMPGQNGYALVHAVRARPDMTNTLVVAWSAHHSTTSSTHAAAFDLCLKKPMHPKELVAAIATLFIDRDGAAGTSASPGPPKLTAARVHASACAGDTLQPAPIESFKWATRSSSASAR